MYIFSQKVVTTRKEHMCGACLRTFKAGTKMNTQVNTLDGIQVWRTCPTCSDLISKHPKEFDDEFNVFMQGCVNESLDKGQTPEDLLIILNNRQLK